MIVLAGFVRLVRGPQAECDIVSVLTTIHSDGQFLAATPQAIDAMSRLTSGIVLPDEREKLCL